MARRQPKGRKPRKPRPLKLAARLPDDAQDLHDHCLAGWNNLKADTAHFASPPGGPQIEAALLGLGNALGAAPGGTPADKEAVNTAATKVRELWFPLVRYAEAVLRALPVEEVPPILANVLMYKSAAGTHKPKPPLAAKHGPMSGSAIVSALAILNAVTYTFEWSLDQSAWSTTTATKSRVTITGLTPGKLYWFRVRAFLRDGTTTDYVSSVSLMMI